MRVAHVCPKVILTTKYAETKDFAAILASAKFLPQPELRVPIASDTQLQTTSLCTIAQDLYRTSDGLPPVTCNVPLRLDKPACLLALGCMRAPRPRKGLAAALPAALAARRTSDTKTKDFVSREMLGDFRCKSRSKVDPCPRG